MDSQKAVWKEDPMTRLRRRSTVGGRNYRHRSREIALPTVSRQEVAKDLAENEFTARIIDDDSPWVAFDLDQIGGDLSC